MMKKTLLTLILVLSFNGLFASTPPDEGIWIPILIEKYNIKLMQEKGFRLTAEDIYSVNRASMKDAIVNFNGGCTAEFISGSGLLITNHHCGYGQIQNHSTLENDYLTNGFWAMSREEELPNPGVTVTLLKYMEDVTSPSELPAEINGLKSQQFRWMKGGAETARKMLPKVWSSGISLNNKIQATVHLLSSSIFIFVFLMGVLSFPLLFLIDPLGLDTGKFSIFFERD